MPFLILLTAVECVQENSNGLERRMRGFFLFYMNAGSFYFGKRKRKKCHIVDENVGNMTREAKPAFAFHCFTVTECVPGNLP